MGSFLRKRGNSVKIKKPGRPLDPKHAEKDAEYRQYPKGPNGESLYFSQVPPGSGGEAIEAGTVGFMARFLVLATLPHSDPGEATIFGRKNGRFSYQLEAGTYLDENQQVRSVGLPYGMIPRLLLCWLTTEAVKTREREIELGDKLSHFMDELEIKRGGGKWGSVPRLREQMKRFFSSKVSYTYQEKRGFFSGTVRVASEARTFWTEDEKYLPSEDTTNTPVLFTPQDFFMAGQYQSRVILGEEFFHEITTRPVPIDLRAVQKLRRSPLALDMYYWFTHRVSYLTGPITIDWKALRTQFGCDFVRLANFKQNFLKYLPAVQEAYPQLRVLVDLVYGVTLYMSRTHVKMRPAAATVIPNEILPPTTEYLKRGTRAVLKKKVGVPTDATDPEEEEEPVPF
jgi:Plasmid encoded RepA protein